jgi:hypothetical protein
MNIDKKLLETTQAAYLWVFDRTGVYVATVGFAIQVSIPFIHTYAKGELDYLSLFVMVFLSLGLSWRYAMQHAEKYEIFNAMSRQMSDTNWRPLMLGVWLALVIANLLTMTLWYALTAFMQLFYFCYVCSWQIRKREPPEKLVFAPQASR